MVQRRWNLVFLGSVLVLFLIGCAKHAPTVTLAAATPAPGAPAPAVALWTPPPPLAAPVEAPVTPVAETAPAPPPPPMPVLPPPPQEFTAIDALKDVHFDFDKYEIRPADAEILDANTAWMKANPEYLILVEGHADERGTNEYNLALGDRRSKATLNYLLARGLAADRFTLVSYGKERPLCSEPNEGCWAQNRRARFLVKGQ
ncbi:MAG: OmpA/MotB domain protein [Candidatus Rokubacteria bacterium CSP1-6]|nr:MAG: OmpA/MotB domain protein [Candidatus Rokubacteria bacterium CSP1-6]